MRVTHPHESQPTSLKVADENIQLLLIRVHLAEPMSQVVSISHKAVVPGSS